jgi:hypothetical protein
LEKRSDKQAPVYVKQHTCQTATYLLIVRQRIDSRLHIIGVFDKFQKMGAKCLVCLSRLAELLQPFFPLEALKEQKNLKGE